MKYKDINSENRQIWLSKKLSQLPSGLKVLDAGAGRLRNKQFCDHLDYTSQDFCQLCEYDDLGKKGGDEGTDSVLSSKIDLVCDINAIPQPDAFYDVILCSEVLEHVPSPTLAINEFSRLLKPNGMLILTAPFASMVHLAPYHYCSGFSHFWYEYHLPRHGFKIKELVPNGDWFSYFYQELMRLGYMSRKYGDWSWPLAYVLRFFGSAYFKIRGGKKASDVACFGWHCVSIKS